MSGGRRLTVLAALAAAAAWLPGLFAPPAYDDPVSVFGNPRVVDPSLLPEAFLHPTPRRVAGIELHYAYRPLTEASFAAVHAIGVRGAPTHRAFSLALHAAAALAVFLLARKLLPGSPSAPSAAVWAAACFLLHPMGVQAVTYLTQRCTLLEAALGFLALLLYLRAREGGGAGALATAAAAAMAASTAKETAITLPLAFAAAEWILRASSPEPARRKLWRWLAVSAACMLPAVQILRAGAGARVFEEAGRGRLDYLVLQATAVARYLGLQAMPFHLHFAYDPLHFEGIPAWASAARGAALAALAGWAILGPARHATPRLAAALFLAPLALECTIFPLRDIAAEHRCYPGLLGTALAFAWAAPRAPRLAGAALALLAALTASENACWADPLAQGRHDVRHAFHAALHWSGYASSHMGRGHDLRAERLSAAPRRLPFHPGVWIAHAEALRRLGRAAEARGDIARILAEHPADSFAIGLAMAQADLDGDAAAVDALAARAEALPDPGLGLLLAVARHHMLRGRPAQAERALARCREEGRLSAQYWDYAGWIAFAQGRFPGAEDAYRRAVAFDPSLYKGHYHLGEILRARGDRRGAAEAYRRALAARPGYDKALAGLRAVGASP